MTPVPQSTPTFGCQPHPRAVGRSESPSIADLGGDCSSRACELFGLLDVSRHGIYDVNRMAIVGEPGGMDSRSTTHLEDRQWS